MSSFAHATQRRFIVITRSVIAELAPTGALRVAINLGNPVLAQRISESKLGGVSVALAEHLAKRLDLSLELKAYDAAGKVFAALEQSGEWDLAFMAIDPVRSEQIAFTEPYVLIEGTYLVRANSVAQTVADLDKGGNRIAVGKGAAYDLYLTRNLEAADLVRAATSAAAIDLFIDEHLDAVAGVRQPLERYCSENVGLRVLPDSFTQIQQAMGVPKERIQAARFLQAFLNEHIQNGFIANALSASGQTDVRIATVKVESSH